MLPTLDEKGSGFGLRYLAFFVLAAIILTWPITSSLDRPTCIRPDYFSNLWNFWWVRTALVLETASPYWTDYLHFPTGISLARHTLSPLNSFAGALLSAVVSPHAAYNVLLLVHFSLSGWTFFLLARYLTGNTRGSLLAGLVYSFCPFHYSYMAQINVATFEFLPLAVLYALKVHRAGGVRNTLLMALFIGMVAASSSYYLAYAFLVIGLVALGGKLWDNQIHFLPGLRRLVLAGMVAVAVVVVVSMPLVLTIVDDIEAGTSRTPLEDRRAARANDILGYSWLGPPEHITVSWPTMVGYSTLVLLVLGRRGVIKQRFWLLVGAVFFVLSLGGAMKVAGGETGIPMPYKYLSSLPGFAMLRKPDRAFLMIQFVIALLCAFSWQHLSARFKSSGRELACWVILTTAIMVETTGIPFARFAYDCPSYLADLAASGMGPSSKIKSLIHLPAHPGSGIEGRYNYFQTFHGKKIPQGYVTSTALVDSVRIQASLLRSSYRSFADGDPERLTSELEKRGIDLVVVHKTVPKPRAPIELDGTTIWMPFVSVRRYLVGGRQIGPYVDTPVRKRVIRSQRRALEEALGPPIHEDSDILVFEGPWPR